MRCGRPLRPETGICPDVRPHRTKAIYQTVSACRDGMIFCSAIPILQAIARWHCHCHAAPNGQPQLRWGLGSSLCSCACKLLRMRVLPSHRVACATMIVVPQQSCSLRDATRGEDYCKARAHGCSDSMLNPQRVYARYRTAAPRELVEAYIYRPLCQEVLCWMERPRTVP